ncbi:AMP-responsive element-binding 3 [Podarcis lilfordi]|uniref:AMP-responsive element-binding 3 n=1 Tax=Podarcis lilfordi TaxID=74358 RepID=A0AA35L634_9SAUR|nr:AMP-responsive element-binding 3 [Podarcis lilfordi]
MNLFWVLYALLANHWCLGDDKDSELCTSAGELPAPDLFLNKTLVSEGETITALCAAPAEVFLTGFFFCKDGAPVSSKKAASQYVQYIVYASPKNAGQYSCGYQQKDAKNQVKISALSVAQNLIVQPRYYDSNVDPGQTIPTYIWILRSSLVLLLLVSAPIITYFMEKCNCSLFGPRN